MVSQETLTMLSLNNTPGESLLAEEDLDLPVS